MACSYCCETRIYPSWPSPYPSKSSSSSPSSRRSNSSGCCTISFVRSILHYRFRGMSWRVVRGWFGVSLDLAGQPVWSFRTGEVRPVPGEILLGIDLPGRLALLRDWLGFRSIDTRRLFMNYWRQPWERQRTVLLGSPLTWAQWSEPSSIDFLVVLELPFFPLV